MKILRVLGWIGLSLFVVWGLIALFHRLTHEPEQSRFIFWALLPYPVFLVLTIVILATCARNTRGVGAGFSWFAVVLGSAASIGLFMVVYTALFSINSWAYFGHASMSFSIPTDSNSVAASIAMFVACYIWAGAISAALSPQRPLLHASASGAALLLWSCAMTLLAQPLVSSQLMMSLALPIPVAVCGAWVQQARRAAHG
jgi:hypothetical protein